MLSTVEKVSVLAVGEDFKEKNTANCCCDLIKSIRTKTTVALIILFGLLILCVLAVLFATFVPGFNNIESQRLQEQARRVLSILYDDFQSSSKLSITNYGNWQEFYDTVTLKTNIETFALANFPGNIMQLMQLNFVIAYDASGTIVFYTSYDLEKNIYSAYNLPNFLQSLNPNGTIYQGGGANADSRFAGAAYDDRNGKVILFTAVPILQGDFKGNVGGLLIFARHITPTLTLDFATRAQVCISTHAIASQDSVVKRMLPRISPSAGARPTLSNDAWVTTESVLVEQLSPGAQFIERKCRAGNGDKPLADVRLASYLLVDDFNRESLFIFRFDTNRDAYQLGFVSIGIGVGVAAGVSILVSIAVLIFMECCVITPMLRIANKVFNIAQTKNVNQQVPKFIFSQRDELASLTNNINSFLEKLATAEKDITNEKTKLDRLRHKKSLEEHRSRAIMNSIKDFIFNVDMEGKFVWSNNSVQTILRFAAQKTWNIELVFPTIKIHQFQELANSKTQMEAEAYSSDKQETFYVKLYVTRVTMNINDTEIETLVILARNQNDLRQVQESLKKEQAKADFLKLGLQFDSMLKNTEKRAKFKEFCKERKDDEYMLFIDAVEQYRATKTASERNAKFAEIMKTFLSNDSDFYLDVVFKTAADEVQKVKDGKQEVDLFKKIEKVVKAHLIQTSFAAFEKEN